MTPEIERLVELLRHMHDGAVGHVGCREVALEAAAALVSLSADKERAEAERDALKRRLNAMLPLFEEARDALPAISTVAARLHHIRLDLADRMDSVGDPQNWAAIDTAFLAKQENKQDE